MEVDGDNIDGTKNCGDVDSIINNVISSVFATSSSLPTSLNVKNTQAERSLDHINVDTKEMIFDIDRTKKVVNVDSTTCDVEISVKHADSISCLAVYNGYIYSGSWGKSLKVWRTSDLKCLESIKAHVTGFVCCSTRSPTPERVTFCLSFKPIDVNFYLEKGIDKFENDTLPIKMVDELPQQTQCDCGEFVCAFNEYVIHGRDIPKEINIGYVCMRYGALLWYYEKRKLQAGIKDNTTKKSWQILWKGKEEEDAP
ncbi:hypothetical protein FXO37_18320 [Capsicum annuum]|nr:hypothetical protein FXO37_18320 [Capsicum annuum]